MSIVVATFEHRNNAEKAVRDLKEKGFGNQQVSLVAKVSQDSDATGLQHQNLMNGTLTGAGAGGGLALLAGAGALAIPGLGPLVAAGPLAASLAGITAGGVIGGLIDYGIPKHKSRRMETDLRQGLTMVSVETSSAKAGEAAKILRSAGAVDVDTN